MIKQKHLRGLKTLQVPCRVKLIPHEFDLEIATIRRFRDREHPRKEIKILDKIEGKILFEQSNFLMQIFQVGMVNGKLLRAGHVQWLDEHRGNWYHDQPILGGFK